MRTYNEHVPCFEPLYAVYRKYTFFFKVVYRILVMHELAICEYPAMLGSRSHCKVNGTLYTKAESRFIRGYYLQVLPPALCEAHLLNQKFHQ